MRGRRQMGIQRKDLVRQPPVRYRFLDLQIDFDHSGQHFLCPVEMSRKDLKAQV
jgi:hypothetical protein